jgi:transposase
MKTPEELFHGLLGLGESWTIKEIRFDREMKEVRIEIDDTPHVVSEARCPNEGGEVEFYDHREAREWRHLDIFEHTCFLRAHVPRVRCKTCGHLFRVRVPWEGLSKHFTSSFEAMALVLMREMPVRKAAEYLREHDTRLWRILVKHVMVSYEGLSFDDVSQIGVDETAAHKRHKYLTIFADLVKRRVLFAVPDKDAATFGAFVRELEKHRGNKENIRCVSMDMSNAYKMGVRDHCPNAKVIFDKFHVVAMANKAVNVVRRAEVRRGECWEQLKGTRMLWLTNPDNLTESQSQQLQDIRKDNLATAKAYQMRLCLQDIYKLPCCDLAKHRFLAWCRWVRTQAKRGTFKFLAAMVKVAETIERNLTGILNHWESRITNAYMEGLCSLVQMVKRRARGYRTDSRFIAMIYFVAGKLPMPIMAYHQK